MKSLKNSSRKPSTPQKPTLTLDSKPQTAQTSTPLKKSDLLGMLIALVIVSLIIWGIFSLVSHIFSGVAHFFSGDRDDKKISKQISKPVISIPELKDDAIVTTDPSYQLTYSVKYDPAPRVKIYVNDKEMYGQKIISSEAGGLNTYSQDLTYALLKYGDNSVKIVADWYSSDTGKNDTESKQINLILNSTQAPIIKVDRATGDDQLLIPSITDATYNLYVDTESSDSKGSGASNVAVNDINIEPSGSRGRFTHKVTLNDGDNTFIITARNNIGEVKKTLTIHKQTPEDLQAAKVANEIDNALSNAKVTCEQYAESSFQVKDVNAHYLDPATITRRNDDGTFLIKVKIADSRGLFRAEEPLGIMECTTDPTGLRATSFITY